MTGATSNESFVRGAFAGLRKMSADADAPDGVSDYHWQAGFILGTVLQAVVAGLAILASLPVVGL